MDNAPRMSRLVIAAMAVGSFAAVGLMAYTTTNGAGISPDALAYIGMAEGLRDGNGVTIDGRPITHYPPGYPILLWAVGQFTAGDIHLAARVLACGLFGLNLILFGIAVWICSGHHRAVTLLSLIYYLTSGPLIIVHSMAWSEAPFIALTMAGFLLLARSISTNSRGMLFLAAVILGYAALTRYIGVVLFPTLLLAIVWLNRQPFRRRLIDAGLACVVAVIPLLAWLIRNKLVADTTTNREIAFHPAGLAHVNDLICSITSFILPLPHSTVDVVKLNLFSIATVTLLVLVISVFRKSAISEKPLVNSPLRSLLLLHTVVYISLIFVSITFYEVCTPLDHRLLSPIFLPILCLLARLLTLIVERSGYARWVWVVLMLVLALHAARAARTILNLDINGVGYASKPYRESEFLEYLRQLQADRNDLIVYSNEPGLLKFHSVANCKRFPDKRNLTSLVENPDYPAKSQEIVGECLAGQAIIAWYFVVDYDKHFDPPERLAMEWGLPIVAEFSHGVIFAVPQGQ